MDPIDKKKIVKYFFDMAPACHNEWVNEYPNTFFNTLIIYSTMGNFRLPQPSFDLCNAHCTCLQLMCMLFKRVYQF